MLNRRQFLQAVAGTVAAVVAGPAVATLARTPASEPDAWASGPYDPAGDMRRMWEMTRSQPMFGRPQPYVVSQATIDHLDRISPGSGTAALARGEIVAFDDSYFG